MHVVISADLGPYHHRTMRQCFVNQHSGKGFPEPGAPVTGTTRSFILFNIGTWTCTEQVRELISWLRLCTYSMSSQAPQFAAAARGRQTHPRSVSVAPRTAVLRGGPSSVYGWSKRADSFDWLLWRGGKRVACCQTREAMTSGLRPV